MANNVTVCGLNNAGGVNPNGVYTLAAAVSGKDSWERTVGAITFSLQYFESLPITFEWHVIDKAVPGTWLAIGSADNNKLPWQGTWVNNGYGIATVTEGAAGCSTCDPRFDKHAYGNECGEKRFRRLRLLGYL